MESYPAAVTVPAPPALPRLEAVSERERQTGVMERLMTRGTGLGDLLSSHAPTHLTLEYE